MTEAPDWFDKTLKDLRGEAARCGGVLERAVVDDYYVVRNIRPERAAEMERILTSEGIEFEAVPLPIPKTLGPSRGGSLDALLQAARAVPYLSHDEEIECGEAIRRHLEYRDEGGEPGPVERRMAEAATAARHRLVTSNLFLVAKVAHARRYTRRMPVADLVSVGVLGLMRATELYDPAVGCRFSTYATWWVRQAMSREVANNGRTVRLPVHVIQDIRDYGKARRACELSTLFRPSDVSKLERHLGWTREKVLRVAQLAQSRELSLDEPIQVGDDKSAGQMLELVADWRMTPDESLLVEDARETVAALVDTLDNERLRDIVRRRFGLGADGKVETLEEISHDYDVTRERIRQLEAKALKTLWPRAKKLHLHDVMRGLGSAGR